MNLRRRLKQARESLDSVNPYHKARVHVFHFYKGETIEDGRAIYDELGHDVQEHDLVIGIRHFRRTRAASNDVLILPKPCV